MKLPQQRKALDAGLKLNTPIINVKISVIFISFQISIYLHIILRFPPYTAQREIFGGAKFRGINSEASRRNLRGFNFATWDYAHYQSSRPDALGARSLLVP